MKKDEVNNRLSKKEFIQKIRLIYFPFILIFLGYIITYSFLHWLLILKFDLFRINEIVIDFVLPFTLPWIAILLILRKRIKILNLTTKRGDLPGLYMFIAVLAISIPTIVAQGYIRTATGKLTKVESIYQINKSNLTKYYQIDSIYLDKRFTGVHWSVDISGRHNEYMNFYGFFALPILKIPGDTIKKYFNIWYGLEYKDQISNRLNVTNEDKEKAFEAFQKSSIAKFNFNKLYDVIYFDRLGYNDERKGLNEAVKATNNYDHSKESIILIPVKEPFELRNESKLGWIFKSFGIGGFIWLLMILYPNFQENELRKFQKEKPIKKSKKINFNPYFQLLIPQKNGCFTTQVVIELNILIFITMVLLGLGFLTFNRNDLLSWGANFRPLIHEGQYWRLVTCIFLHGGLMHLLMNMYGLFFVGILLEPLLGSKRFAVFYLVAGIVASISSIWWHEDVVSVGASGAIFGMYGIFLALLLTKLFPKDFQKSFLLSTGLFVGYNLIFGLTGGIDNAAHIGGLLIGIIIGFAIYPKLNSEKVLKNTKLKYETSRPN